MKGDTPSRDLLLVSHQADDRRFLGELLPYPEWRLRFARSPREAQFLLQNNDISVVVCEERLPGGGWQDILPCLSGEKLIVTSRAASERLWAEVLNLGGFDVLAKPWDRFEVLRSLQLASERSLPSRVLQSHVPVEEVGAC